MRYFSEQNQAFYIVDDIVYPTLPDDIKEITEVQHNQMYEQLNSGKVASISEDGTISYSIRAIIITWSDIKARRDAELGRTDYTQMPDWPGNKEAWTIYRQALRDIPQNFSDPNSVVWPTKPE